MIKQLFRNIVGLDKDFPKLVKDYWYCGEWYLYRGKKHDNGEEYRSDCTEWPIEGKVLFNPEKCELYNSNTDGIVDGLIPAIKVNGRIGLYKAEPSSGRRSAFYDGLPWDNGVKINLRFVRSIAELPEEWSGFENGGEVGGNSAGTGGE